ncbi:MAG: cytochrome c [Gammaproteobacteria bacterium]|nr:cytochrome c [Gammaproteobacteria bacterium]
MIKPHFFDRNVYSTFYTPVPEIPSGPTKNVDKVMMHSDSYIFSGRIRVSIGLWFSLFVFPGICYAETTGERLFLENCAECHQEDGEGIPNIYPSLADNELVLGSGADVALVLIIGRGEMPSFNGVFTDKEMAHVVNYIRSVFGNIDKPISTQTISLLR